eukprot:755086-Hanusia_phi.AAC.6
MGESGYQRTRPWECLGFRRPSTGGASTRLHVFRGDGSLDQHYERSIRGVYIATSKLFGNEWDGSVTLLSKDKSVRTCHLPCGVSDVAIVSRKSHIGVACDDGNVLVIESSSIGVTGWRPLHILAEHDDMVTSVGPCLSAAGKLASASADGSVKTWSLAVSGESGSLASFSGHNAAVWDVEFQPDEEHVERIALSLVPDRMTRCWRASGRMGLSDFGMIGEVEKLPT